MTNIYKAIVRSLTPWVISSIVWLSIHLGFHLSLISVTEIAAIIGTLLTILAHFLEVKWPWFGVFLGWIGAPTYTPSVSKKQLAAELAALQSQLNVTNPPAPGSPVAVILTPNA